MLSGLDACHCRDICLPLPLSNLVAAMSISDIHDLPIRDLCRLNSLKSATMERSSMSLLEPSLQAAFVSAEVYVHKFGAASHISSPE